MNQSIQFKTNIKCGGCIATVTPFLNEAVGEGNWKVDVQNPDKVLTVETADSSLVKQAVEKAGYKAEQLA
ncbi:MULTISPECIES: heavy-metal-associated domain-containing protein [unclassified Spirosoma]|uniref:heavy-metal-associated domain-containing protein n=1 Tax=unclassified Spirosoma TaxID=2621999 RepID=UPI000963EFCC|nr:MULTISPECIES: heavy-metal-associated domain-containing protein [unclassified Spirosoma]MBN8820818.1 heavy-metal-associated domain-containing protein [Spirosoma sp.]OJW78401.1 MAG: heavy metal transport/detoxification protein [Spirosoma sp. 48-14]